MQGPVCWSPWLLHKTAWHPSAWQRPSLMLSGGEEGLVHRADSARVRSAEG